jgi:hypothetical protein
LTGKETPRDLEVLHYLATAGEIDMEISRVKFGAKCLGAVWYLMQLGHPIVEMRTSRSTRRGTEQRRWVWLPALSDFSSPKDGTTSPSTSE